MPEQTVFITGGYGCIGAEATKWLIKNTDANVVLCSRSVNAERTERVFHGTDLSRVTIVAADVTDQSALEEILTTHQVTHVIHLAAFQSPDCNNYRDQGLQINLAGTQNLIEAIKATKAAVQRFVFASSIAVYGPRAMYPEGRVPMTVEPAPVNVYGAWKLAGENISRIFHNETGIPTSSLRPGVLYGPGRDQGLTCTPTTAMKKFILGQPYEIPFCNQQDYLFAPDVGAAFALAAMEPFEGYSTFTLPSLTLTTAEIAEAIKSAAADLEMQQQFQITIGNDEVPFICDLDFEPFLDAFPTAPHTTLNEAVRISLQTFSDQAERGWLSI